ncbi:MAG: LemA family protein [Deltaproteobacteria bacterium]|nr:LemA family protein [Deltaproteobacteria bacterium]
MAYTEILMIAGAVFALIGMALLIAARRADRKNYIIEKATPLPLALVNVRDDVWLRGIAECDEPLDSPHFGISCLYYEYRLEEKITRTSTDSKGNTRTETSWVVRKRDHKAASFRLAQGDLSIGIASLKAEFKNLEKKSRQVGNFRHILKYLPYPAKISAVGSVSEGKRQLEPYAGIPLIVTTLDRAEFEKKSERTESLMRFFGFVALWLGSGLFFYGLLDYLSYPVVTNAKFNSSTLLLALLFATGLYLSAWSMYMYNTFVQYRHRIDNAWSNIDPDLRMRYNLIPNLVQVVKAYMAHESDLLESVSNLRNQAVPGTREERVGAEAKLAGSTAKLLAVIEAYPELKADRTVAGLVEQLKALEEKLAHSREFYNQTVREYNDSVMAMPRGILAKIFGFKTHGYFEINNNNNK